MRWFHQNLMQIQKGEEFQEIKNQINKQANQSNLLAQIYSEGNGSTNFETSSDQRNNLLKSSNNDKNREENYTCKISNKNTNNKKRKC